MKISNKLQKFSHFLISHFFNTSHSLPSLSILLSYFLFKSYLNFIQDFKISFVENKLSQLSHKQTILREKEQILFEKIEEGSFVIIFCLFN